MCKVEQIAGSGGGWVVEVLGRTIFTRSEGDRLVKVINEGWNPNRSLKSAQAVCNPWGCADIVEKVSNGR